MKNKDVIEAWLNGESLICGHLTALDGDLFSYQLKIGTRTEIFDYTSTGVFRSKTTSAHVRLAQKMAGARRTFIQPSAAGETG